MSQKYPDEFKNPVRLKEWTIRFLYAQIAVALVVLVSNSKELDLLFFYWSQEDVYLTEEMTREVEDNENRQTWVAFLYVINYVISGFLILRWICRANYNARGLGAPDMVFTPGWSIGWYFVPLFNLWKPYGAMKEIWRESASLYYGEPWSVSKLLPLWWLFWIVSYVLNTIESILLFKVETIERLIAVNAGSTTCMLVGIPLSILLIAIINKVHIMQLSYFKYGHNAQYFPAQTRF